MKFEVYQQGGLQALTIGSSDWRWRLKSGNGEIIAQGEGYRNKQDCLDAIALIKSTTPATPVYER